MVPLPFSCRQCVDDSARKGIRLVCQAIVSRRYVVRAPLNAGLSRFQSTPDLRAEQSCGYGRPLLRAAHRPADVCLQIFSADPVGSARLE